MAESIISPGVYTRENDTSYITPAPIQAGAAFVGPTVKGPKNQPLIVTSYSDYVRKFGETFLSGSNRQYEFLTSVAVKNYFQNGGQTALITRIVSGTYSPALSTQVASGKTEVPGTYATASMSSLAAVDTGSYSTVTVSDTAGNFYYFTAYTGNGDFNYYNAAGNYGYFSPNAGVAPYTLGQWTASLASLINSQATETGITLVTGGANLAISSSAAGISQNGTKIYTATYSGQTTGFGAAKATLGGGTAGTTTTTFVLKTLGEGTLYNNSTAVGDAGAQNSDGSLISGSSDNVRWEVTNINNALGTFTLTVRDGLDSANNKTILETFNVNLDPFSDNYIEKVIGNQYTTVATDGSTSYNTQVGEYPNASNYIRVSAVNYTTPNYLGTDGVTVGNDETTSYSASLPIASSGSFYGGLGTVKAGAKFFGDITNTSTDAQGVVAANYTTALSLLSNKDEYQFNIVSAPGLLYKNSLFTSTVNSFISLAESRGDCIAVVDLVGLNEPAVTNVTAQAATLNSSYAATYWPWLQIKSATGRNEWTPAGTVIPGVYAFTDASSAPWFAPAGLVRGGIGGVIQAERKLTKGNRDTLYSAKVNPIATFPGSGISVFGQKTLQTKASALDRVNVRRLLIELKKFIGDQARNLVFEQNTISTRNKFLATVNPYLESVVQRQGLYAYRVVMDDTNNTADVVDRNQLVGQIFIQPAKTIEFVVLDFTIEPTGATFG
ncbi:tail sheath protein [uncultured Caudovirales phage]|uniref:Tail sheath protein n=1 Tax=uncultured Caudovirales phage TaxID=2100421 RepID=A0A6J5KV31_9CAUD|nr:tail sheath protein [uncultured Caudovirales phage]